MKAVQAKRRYDLITGFEGVNIKVSAWSGDGEVAFIGDSGTSNGGGHKGPRYAIRCAFYYLRCIGYEGFVTRFG